jgi:hypothetical protein
MIDAADTNRALDSETSDRTAVLYPRRDARPVGQALEKTIVYPVEKCRCLTVTPEIAATALATTVSRGATVDRRHVEKLAGEMAAGRFHADGDTICFDWNGRLINGQHRLYADTEATTVKEGSSIREVEDDEGLATCRSAQSRSVPTLENEAGQTHGVRYEDGDHREPEDITNITSTDAIVGPRVAPFIGASGVTMTKGRNVLRACTAVGRGNAADLRTVWPSLSAIHPQPDETLP